MCLTIEPFPNHRRGYRWRPWPRTAAAAVVLRRLVAKWPVVACWEMDRWLEHLRDDELALLARATGRRVGPGQVEALLADPAA
jgi:hypothetical protein